jgi:hypothetical protein
MKIVNCLKSNIIITLILCLIIFTQTLNIGIGGLKKKLTHHKIREVESNTTQTAQQENKNKELPDIPVYYKGWIKYLHYTIKEKQKPKAFYKNTEFVKQKLTKEEIAKKDDVRIFNYYLRMVL